MTSARAPCQAGFTFFEIVIGMVLVLSGVSAFGVVVGSTDRLSKSSQLHTRVTREHRRNLNTIANHLAGAWIDSLAGFDAEGLAQTCTFQRVVDQDKDGVVYGQPETLRWVQTTGATLVDGKPVGRVILTDAAGSETLVADRVPQDTFFIRQQGRNLVVHLSTYYRTSEDQLVLLTGETSVTLRN